MGCDNIVSPEPLRQRYYFSHLLRWNVGGSHITGYDRSDLFPLVISNHKLCKYLWQSARKYHPLPYFRTFLNIRIYIYISIHIMSRKSSVIVFVVMNSKHIMH